MAAADPCLVVRAARRRLGAVDALVHVDLALRPGEWVGLVGPNGAGKTTLLKTLCGLETLDGGEIVLHGCTVGRGLRPLDRRHVGIVPQEIALYPLLTARENLEVFGRLNGLSGRVRGDRVRWALAWTGLEARADHRVHTFSGGMKRRLNIACSVLHRPGIVLLDEPTVGVDPAGRSRIEAMLRGLRDDGTALLQSSHQLDEVQAACDRILLVNRGRVVASLRLDGAGAATLGRTRAVRLTLDRAANGLDLGRRLRAVGRRVEGTVADVSRDLADLLQRIRAADLQVLEVRVETPRLEDVFAELTGWRGEG